jgi:hypothetical protein
MLVGGILMYDWVSDLIAGIFVRSMLDIKRKPGVKNPSKELLKTIEANKRKAIRFLQSDWAKTLGDYIDMSPDYVIAKVGVR